ncbi:MAG TPA: DUF5985 family protein [Candidatus Binataceae bacterium]|nr:DUF5985 family protein [Candidatus Binataceae bacterium]
MGFALSTLFFLRFWQRTGDIFFGWFTLAFLLFTLNYLIDAFLSLSADSIFAYLLRLLGFAVIVVAIHSKNAGKESPPR